MSSGVKNKDIFLLQHNIHKKVEGGRTTTEPSKSAILHSYSTNFQQVGEEHSCPTGPMETLRNRRITPTSSINRGHKCARAQSAFGATNHHCICGPLWPVIKLAQLFGILPINQQRGACTISFKWKSIPMLINSYWAWTNVIGIFMWYPRFYRFLRGNLNGTDFYTHFIAITIQTLSSCLLFFSGSVAGIHLAKAWPKLHDTVNEMALPNFRFVKYFVYLIPLYLLQEISLNAAFMVGEMWYDGWEWDTLTFQIKSSTFFVNFVPNLSSAIFALLIIIISQNYKGINDQLTELQINHFNRFESSPQRVSDEDDIGIVIKLARLRILHENLCEVVRNLEVAFGLQMQAIFAATSVSFLVGVYNLIVAVSGIWAESDDRLEFIIKIGSTGLMPILAAVRILVVVLCGQALTNNANEAGHILSGFNIINASAEAKHQVRKFLDKIGMFPVQLSANGIIELGASFLGPATGNLITYILVMMQFRLDDDPSATVPPIITNVTSIFSWV